MIQKFQINQNDPKWPKMNETGQNGGRNGVNDPNLANMDINARIFKNWQNGLKVAR